MRKRDTAIALLEDDDLVLSVQVLQEFYVQATRSTRTDALEHEVAAGSSAPGCGSRCKTSRCPSSSRRRSKRCTGSRIGMLQSWPPLRRMAAKSCSPKI